MWAAMVIQEHYRRHRLQGRAKAAERAAKLEASFDAEASAASKKGLGSRLVKSLSFSRRKKPPAKPPLPSDLAPEDLISARGERKDGSLAGATLLVMGAQTLGPAKTGAKTPEPTTAGKPRTRISRA